MRYIIAPLIGIIVASFAAAWLGVGDGGLFGIVPVWLFEREITNHVIITTGIGFVAGLLVFFLLPVGSGSKQYGAARFATRRDISNMGLFAKKGIILAKAAARYIRFDDSLSVAVLAPPGAGKTAGVVIPTLLSCGNSMVIIDIKGELYDVTAKRRGEFSNVLRFAPAEDNSMAWNPLDKEVLPQNWPDMIQTVDRIASVLIPVRDESDYWNLSARSCLVFYALYLIHQHGETNLADIRATALETGDPQGWIEEALIDAGDALPQRVIEEGNILVSKADKEFSGVFSSFIKCLNVFADQRVAKATSSNDFTATQLRKQRTSLYLAVSAVDIDRLAPLFRLFLESIALHLLATSPASDDVNVTFILDEFIRLGKMKVLIENPALSRASRFNSVFIAQDSAQIESLYGASGMSELETTTAYKVIFQQNNIATAEKISRMIGDKTQVRKSQSSSRGNVSRSHSDEAARLVKPQDIMALSKDKCLILAQGNMERPIKANICFWFKDRALSRVS